MQVQYWWYNKIISPSPFGQTQWQLQALAGLSKNYRLYVYLFFKKCIMAGLHQKIELLKSLNRYLPFAEIKLFCYGYKANILRKSIVVALAFHPGHP